jgi:hypothetical protein
MSDQTSLMARIGQWINVKREKFTPVFKEVSPDRQIQPLQRAGNGNGKPRSFLWRPWARRDAAIAGLQQGFDSLNDLLGSIREHMQSQSRRQDEMAGYLSHLPHIMETMPETQRMHGEALQAIGQHLQEQTQQNGQLAEVLQRLGESQGGQQQLLQSLAGNTQTLGEHNQTISANLRDVGSAMALVGKHSETSTVALQQLQNELSHRDRQLGQIIQRQNKRLTIMLAVAMAVSVLALTAAGALGFLLMRR